MNPQMLARYFVALPELDTDLFELPGECWITVQQGHSRTKNRRTRSFTARQCLTTGENSRC